MVIQNKKCQYDNKAFTLVELIVVITILAILWTIAFISLQWYSKDARNSTRVSDIKSIEKVFSFYHLRESNFPAPTNGEQVTYSWAEVWTQWTFWESTRAEIWSKWNISNVPQDPLTWTQYTYSVLNTGQEYQIAWVFEWDLSADLNLTSNSYAAWAYGSTYIRWNYNGQMAKTQTGWVSYVLAVPSIIKWNTTDTDLETIISSKKLTFKGSHNIPSSYSWTLSATNFNDETITDNIINPNELVVFSWDISILNDSANIAERKTLLTNLQNAYTGTLVSATNSVENIINLDITDDTAIEKLAVTLVNNNLGWAMIVSSGLGSTPPSNSCATTPTFTNLWATTTWTPTSVWQAWTYNEIPWNCTYTCATWFTGTSCTTPLITNYPWCDTADITVSWITIAACNVWTNTAATAYNDSASYGDYIQFGKSDNSWVNWTSSYTYDWKSPGWTDNWSANYWWVSDVDKQTITYNTSTTADQTKMQWPCASWYHVPTNKEWVDLIAAANVTSVSTAYSILKLPTAGFRNLSNGAQYGRGSIGYYWSASPDGSNGYSLYFNSSSIDPSSNINRAYGFSVRCFKN